MSAEATDCWWTNEPNPSCVDWCTREHAPEEFSDGGGMSCWQTLVREPGRFEVVVQTTIYADPDERPTLFVEAPSIDVILRTDALSPDEAFALAQGILVGVRLCHGTRWRPGT